MRVDFYSALPGFPDLDKLDPLVRKEFLEAVNREKCACGCQNETVAWCLVNDKSCPVVKSRAKKIYDEIKIGTVDELEAAAREGRIAAIPGFGAKTQEKILAGIQELVRRDRRHLGRRALRQAGRNLRRQRMLSPWALREMAQYLRPGFHPNDIDTDALVHEWRERLAPQMAARAS